LHETHVKSLWEFDGDDVDDYEGHKWMDDYEEEYEEY
jgi:hypothetical protein